MVEWDIETVAEGWNSQTTEPNIITNPLTQQLQGGNSHKDIEEWVVQGVDGRAGSQNSKTINIHIGIIDK